MVKNKENTIVLASHKVPGTEDKMRELTSMLSHSKIISFNRVGGNVDVESDFKIMTLVEPKICEYCEKPLTLMLSSYVSDYNNLLTDDEKFRMLRGIAMNNLSK